ncbi:MAG: HAD family hydrolase, partial [Oscillospiraceae bacterium]
IGYCKPNPEYYREIIRRLGATPEQCLMVGNDVTEDMEAARKAGLSVFLLTDCLINKERRDISVYPRGSFEQLMEFIIK